MRRLSIVFGAAVFGVVFSFAMSVVTAVKLNREKTEPKPLSIPLPADPGQASSSGS